MTILTLATLTMTAPCLLRFVTPRVLECLSLAFALGIKTKLHDVQEQMHIHIHIAVPDVHIYDQYGQYGKYGCRSAAGGS